MSNKKKEETFIDFFKTELNKRNNPTDLKPSIIGKIVVLNPLTVQITEERVLLVEGENLEISEWFKFRCNIDKDGILSSSVPSNTDKAKSIKETHSQGGKPCKMPDAISNLANAILGIRDELLALKCNLSVGDFVIVNSLTETNRYILIDKVL